MYAFIKSTLKLLIPTKLLFILEPFFRKLNYLFYRGNKYECPVCSKGLTRFINIETNDLICPNCGSTKRNRKLWQLLNSDFLKLGIKVLDFSPSRALYRKFKNNKEINYIATDLSIDFISDKNLDITQIEEQDNAYDLIICYHILEHIIEDVKAMKELFRILKAEGKCIIQTPFEDNLYEDYTIVSEEERLKHFGQKDHVRIYSVEVLKSRLEQVGFAVDVRNFSEVKDNKFGIKEQETILICSKC